MPPKAIIEKCGNAFVASCRTVLLHPKILTNDASFILGPSMASKKSPRFYKITYHMSPFSLRRPRPKPASYLALELEGFVLAQFHEKYGTTLCNIFLSPFLPRYLNIQPNHEKVEDYRYLTNGELRSLAKESNREVELLFELHRRMVYARLHGVPDGEGIREFDVLLPVSWGSKRRKRWFGERQELVLEYESKWDLLPGYSPYIRDFSSLEEQVELYIFKLSACIFVFMISLK
ncbi:hypothetical protein HYALB_00006322 [Hymenoscyphus albidus]|uniref:Uncharacterized protein n=1 Tax=Hymenoscyphus albidus TaxID=595503 RepID=A0A9N9LJN9_9HELO|nr:hypothetical protein HYALB_00006322 [Hymenoscyphus albidus]